MPLRRIVKAGARTLKKVKGTAKYEAKKVAGKVAKSMERNPMAYKYGGVAAGGIATGAGAGAAIAPKGRRKKAAKHGAVAGLGFGTAGGIGCLLYTSPSPRD